MCSYSRYLSPPPRQGRERGEEGEGGRRGRERGEEGEGGRRGRKRGEGGEGGRRGRRVVVENIPVL